MIRSDFIHSFQELCNHLAKQGYDIEKIRKILPDATHPFPMLIPTYYASLIDWNDPNDPLMKMVLPVESESKKQEYEVKDPIGDDTHSPVPGLVHRYPDRCLIMLTNACVVNCRFCFRKNKLSEQRANLGEIMDYLANHSEIKEVIFSGGDPFTMPDQFILSLIYSIKKLTHITTIRFHTRTPVVYPDRVTDELLKVLREVQSLVVVLHINHPREVTEQFQDVCQKLRATGAMLLSQTVLLKGVNDSAEVLESLFRSLINVGVKPYYLHHLDKAAGTHHFRVSVQQGKQIYSSLRGTLSGICIPEYVIDVPGGYGKIPVSWFQDMHDGRFAATSFKGFPIIYIDPLHGV